MAVTCADCFSEVGLSPPPSVRSTTLSFSFAGNSAGSPLSSDSEGTTASGTVEMGADLRSIVPSIFLVGGRTIFVSAESTMPSKIVTGSVTVLSCGAATAHIVARAQKKVNMGARRYGSAYPSRISHVECAVTEVQTRGGVVVPKRSELGASRTMCRGGRRWRVRARLECRRRRGRGRDEVHRWA